MLNQTKHEIEKHFPKNDPHLAWRVGYLPELNLTAQPGTSAIEVPWEDPGADWKGESNQVSFLF